jgi:uncharacterized membrane protein
MNSDFNRRPPIMPGIAKGNIETIMQIEQAYMRQRSRVDRFCETISRFAGSISFVIAHIIGFVGWVVVNTGAFPGVDPMDPYPFSFLALIVAMEAIFLSAFVLMAQNRQTRQADHWAHLTLQIGLLGEQETTKVLQMLKLICARLGLDKVASDGELTEMVGKTSVGALAEELAQNLEKTRDLIEPVEGGK